jgi:hypothetical protein
MNLESTSNGGPQSFSNFVWMKTKMKPSEPDRKKKMVKTALNLDEHYSRESQLEVYKKVARVFKIKISIFVMISDMLVQTLNHDALNVFPVHPF